MTTSAAATAASSALETHMPIAQFPSGIGYITATTSAPANRLLPRIHHSSHKQNASCFFIFNHE